MPLTAAYHTEYETLLEHLGSHCAELPDHVCLHWPMAEPTHSGGLLAIGQALNGWMIDEPTCQLWRPDKGNN